MARKSYSKSKNCKTYYVIEDYYRNGKRTTRILETIGKEKDIMEWSAKDNLSVDAWIDRYVNNYNREHSVPNPTNEVIITKYADKIIPKYQARTFNIGYLFLKKIYYDLKINKIIKEVTKKHKFTFDLNEVLSNLVFARIIFPASKLKTYQLTKNFIENPKYDIQNLYKGLTYFKINLDFIQKEIYNNTKNIIDRNTRITYFDCTNYYFSIKEEDKLRKYGKSKDHKPNPIVGMGLFMDGNGIPIAMNIYPGNESETKKLIPLQEKIVQDFNLDCKDTIICTDAAMCTDEIKQFNIKDGRSFVITQSIKKLKQKYKEEVFDDDGWRILGKIDKVYNLNDILSDENLTEQHTETIFYKIIKTETANVVQDLIVTFQIKYRNYLRNVRNGQIQRAMNMINQNKSGEKIKLGTNQNDYRRFIKESVSTIKPIKNDKGTNSLNEVNNKDANYYTYSIDENAIRDEEKYDGYYGLTTNLVGDVSDILNIVKQRWEIEESFRIMKDDFDSGTVYLSREDRIIGHFLTCFLSLLIYRILENKLQYKYTNTQIIEKLKEMEVFEQKGFGYEPGYVRDDLTDDLHEIFGFRTDFEITSYENYKKIFDSIKRR